MSLNYEFLLCLSGLPLLKTLGYTKNTCTLAKLHIMAPVWQNTNFDAGLYDITGFFRT